MKIDKKESKLSKKAVIIAAVLLVLAAGGVAAAYQFGVIKTTPEKKTDAPAATNQVDYKPATDEQKQAGTEAKKDFIERTDKEETTPTPTPGVSSVSITNASQEGVTLRVRTTISSQAAGSCKLTLSMPGQTSIVREAEIQDMGSYSTCKGFDIDTTSMTKGAWKVSVFFSGDSEGTAATTTAEVR